jgi:hypothetical protein
MTDVNSRLGHAGLSLAFISDAAGFIPTQLHPAVISTIIK